VLATAIKMFGLKGQLTNRVKTAAAFDGLFSESAPRTDTPRSIASAEHIPAPRPFASGTTVDQAKYGLDDMQHELVQGVDTLTRPAGAEPLPLAGHPPTQAAASDFINARNRPKARKRK
jgi:hypothetical protein